MLSRETSMEARILKAMYNPHTSILQAKAGSRPPYAWKSICAAIPIVNEGYIWQVGDGKSIRVWKDKWIKREGPSMVQSPRSHLSEDAMVNDLIDRQGGWWNIQLLKDNFKEAEVEEILQIPVSQTSSPDKLVWKGTTDSCFSVRSAYHLQKQKQATERRESLNTGNKRELWKCVWKMQTTDAVKVFIWHACKDTLLTKQKLCKKKMVSDPLCPICFKSIENPGHILWSCPSTQDVWLLGNRKMQKAPIIDEVGSIFMQVLKRIEPKEISLFAETARSIWIRIKKWIFEGNFLNPSILFNKMYKHMKSSLKLATK